MSVFPTQLISVLRQLSPDFFLSGEQIAQVLGCSRATVHNAIRAAQETGFSVQAVHGRGYRLTAPVSWLELERISPACAAHGITLRYQDQVVSTNTLMLEWAAAGGGVEADPTPGGLPQRAPHRALVSAEWQSGGRGRRGRGWFAGLGGGLVFSYLWRSARPAAQLSGLSLAVGVALVEGLRGIGLVGAQVKWPNDIQVAGAKLAGVLIELASDKFASDVLAPSTAVIGVGINILGGEALTRQVGQPVTDLQTHLAAQARPLDRNDLLLHLVKQLDTDLARFESHGFAAFQDQWHACHAHQGQPVCLLNGLGEATYGAALGVDAQGALLLQTATGVRAMHSGEVSLRAVQA